MSASEKFKRHLVAVRVFKRAEAADRSDHPNVVEYAAQTLMKGKSPAAAAKDTAKKHHGSDNMFFGPGETHIDPKKLENQLWERLVDRVVYGIGKMKEGMGHFALDGAIQQFNQKPNIRKELKKRVIDKLGKDPFINDKD